MTDIDTTSGQADWAARKDEIASAFQGGMINPVVDRALGVSLMASGVAVIASALLSSDRGERRLLTSIVGGLLLLGGFTVIGGGAFGRRSQHISAAEQDIRDQLGGLDPVARARVLADMAKEQAEPITSRLKHES